EEIGLGSRVVPERGALIERYQALRADARLQTALGLAHVHRPGAREIAVGEHEAALRLVLVYKVARGPVGVRRELGAATVRRHVRIERARVEDLVARAGRRADLVGHQRQVFRKYPRGIERG